MPVQPKVDTSLTELSIEELQAIVAEEAAKFHALLGLPDPAEMEVVATESNKEQSTRQLGASDQARESLPYGAAAFFFAVALHAQSIHCSPGVPGTTRSHGLSADGYDFTSPPRLFSE